MLARTVTLELLRHGPSNNQLLSPLTAYLALCGNYDAETVHVGFEHVQLLRRMRGLRYQDGRSAEVSALEEASAEVSKLIAGIRSLTAEISSVPRGAHDVIHLRLVLSASELALLPFELIRSPSGFPGHGQWLSLQTAVPIALTREVRRVAATHIRWPDRPRILVVAARPPGVASVPLRAHLLALRWALDRWLYTGTAEELGRHVTVLPQASIAAVREACARAAGKGVPYTHVHVLAHGVPDEAIVDGVSGYGLAFHQDGDPGRMDVVSGTRLAAALRCHPEGPIGGDLSGPAVVTVASCDSANVGSVIGAGASIAHQLHEAGIPLVLASQFPLSVRGSAIMAEVVYTRLLRGEDPRTLVHDLRQALHVACPDTHDWASVVAYAALPADIDAQVKRARSQRAVAAVEAAFRWRDDLECKRRDAGSASFENLRRAMDWLRTTVPGDDEVADPAERTRTHGVLAAISKRVAEARYPRPLWPILTSGAAPPREELRYDDPAGVPFDASMAPSVAPAAEVAMLREGPPPASPADVEAQADARRLLEEARRYYLEIYRRGCGEAWPVVQYLAISNALFPADRELPERDRVEAVRAFEGYWTTAYVLADDNVKSKAGRESIWAHAALVELFVLAQVLPRGHWARQEAELRAHRHLDAILQSTHDFDRYSMRRQLMRYTDWWWKGQRLAELPAALDRKMAEMGVGATHVG